MRSARSIALAGLILGVSFSPARAEVEHGDPGLERRCRANSTFALAGEERPAKVEW